MRKVLRAAGLFVLAVALAACGGIGGASPTGAPAAGESANDVLQRALAAHTAGRIDEATVLYYQTLSKDPNNAFAFFNLGQIAHTRNQLVAAESWYRLSLENDKAQPQALYNLALVRQSVGDPNESAALLRRLLQAQPNNASAHYNLGLALRSLGQTSEANAEFATAQRLDARLVPPAGTVAPRPSPTR